MEGLNLLIKDATSKGNLKGIVISSELVLTHILLVDDVVVFDHGLLEEWRCFKSIIDLFSAPSGMLVNIEKSSFLFNNLNSMLIDDLKGLLHYKMDPIEVGFKYLGYWVKPLNYMFKY